MTIDEAIVHAREVASRKFDDRVHCIRCAEEHEQLAEWLEELKELRTTSCGYSKEDIELNRNAMYSKAIDDFVRLANTMPTVEEDGEIRPMWLEEIADQLKTSYGKKKYILHTA